MNTHESNQKSNTVEAATVRTERQRERADKWRDRYGIASDQLKDRLNEIMQLNEKWSDEKKALETAHAETVTELKQERDEWKRKARGLHRDLMIAISNLDRQSEAVRIGKQEIKRRRDARRERLAEKLVREFKACAFCAKERLWVDRSIRRRLGVPGHVEVVYMSGEGRPKLTGKPGYYTTMSGDLITYPGAYNWPKNYHCSTEQIKVSSFWASRNIKKLALAEAATRIK